jgi:hypothetical protein
MRVPAVLYVCDDLIRDMDAKVYGQIVNVATLPAIQKARDLRQKAFSFTEHPDRFKR